MENMFYEGNYSVALRNGTVEINGKVDTIDYTKLLSFLNEKINKSDSVSINLDFRKVLFINSLGIKVFARFIYNSKNKIVILIDSSIEWQNIALAPLANIRPEGEVSLKIY